MLSHVESSRPAFSIAGESTVGRCEAHMHNAVITGSDRPAGNGFALSIGANPVM